MTIEEVPVPRQTTGKMQLAHENWKRKKEKQNMVGGEPFCLLLIRIRDGNRLPIRTILSKEMAAVVVSISLGLFGIFSFHFVRCGWLYFRMANGVLMDGSWRTVAFAYAIRWKRLHSFPRATCIIIEFVPIHFFLVVVYCSGLGSSTSAVVTPSKCLLSVQRKCITMRAWTIKIVNVNEK